MFNIFLISLSKKFFKGFKQKYNVCFLLKNVLITCEKHLELESFLGLKIKSKCLKAFLITLKKSP